MAVFFLLLAAVAAGWAQEPSAAFKKPPAKPNTLTPGEKAAGWVLLFDGQTTAGWRGAYRQSFPPSGWVVEDGALKKVAATGKESQAGGDIVTVKEYSNFELQLEWRLTPGGNSGIKYFVVENLPRPQGSAIGLEMQILDDDRHPDARMGRDGNRTAGALYDLIPPAKDKVLRPIGEWNHVRILVQGRHVEHWLNGVKVVEYERGSPEFRALVAQSKFKNIPGFGEAPKGHILLQDHGDEVWFRNIKIRELPAAKK